MKRLALFSCALLLAGCTVGPNYHRPAINTPGAYRGETAVQTSSASVGPLGNEKWWTVFQDPVLQQLIRIALKQNYDIQIAATRVLQAQAELEITRSNQFPIVSAGGNIYTEGNPKTQNSKAARPAPSKQHLSAASAASCVPRAAAKPAPGSPPPSDSESAPAAPSNKTGNPPRTPPVSKCKSFAAPRSA